jgi:hypothetical protein
MGTCHLNRLPGAFGIQVWDVFLAAPMHHRDMDADQVATLRALLANTAWLDRAGMFGRALRTSTKTEGGLLVVGTPAEEPWHLTAHLDEESRLAGIPELMPTLVRWAPPPGAPPHLSVGLSRLEEARRGETLFVVAEDSAPAPLLERVNDARHTGATIMALDQGDPELDGLAHEYLSVPGPPALTSSEGRSQRGQAAAPSRAGAPRASQSLAPGDEIVSRLVSFDSAQHLVSAAAATRDRGGSRAGGGVRARLARLLDVVAGTPST